MEAVKNDLVTILGCMSSACQMSILSIVSASEPRCLEACEQVAEYLEELELNVSSKTLL